VLTVVKTWVGGGQNSKVVDTLRAEIEQMETKRDNLVEANKEKIFAWAGRTLRNGSLSLDDEETKRVRELLAEYDSLSKSILEKETSLYERLDEQTKLDSLG
jgi:hypothetical protein